MSSKGEGFLRFLNFLLKLADDREAYVNIKKDEELRKQTTYFGRQALLRALVFVIVIGIGALALIGGFTKNFAVIGNIALIAGGFGAALISLEYYLLFVNASIKQFIINKKFISVFCFLLIFVVTAIAVGIVFVTGKAIDQGFILN